MQLVKHAATRHQQDARLALVQGNYQELPALAQLDLPMLMELALFVMYPA